MLYRALHLDQDEHVIFQVRKHWIIFVGYAFSLVVVAVSPIILLGVSKMFISSLPDINFFGNRSALLLFFYTIWILVLWLLFFVQWTKYYLDVWYVTEKRIIVIDQKGIFHREVSNLHFDRIQDVTLDVHGFIPTLLKFGNIRVQTASENSQEFFMNTVRHPEEVRRIIFSHQNKNIDNRN